MFISAVHIKNKRKFYLLFSMCLNFDTSLQGRIQIEGVENKIPRKIQSV